MGHVGFADPVCADLAGWTSEAAKAVGARVHRGGTYVCIDGPMFSTRAESKLLSLLGRRRHRHDQPARGQARARGRDVLRHDRARHRLRLLARIRGGRVRRGGRRALAARTSRCAKAIVRETVARIPAGARARCARGAAKHAIMTAPEAIPAAAKQRLWAALRKVLGLRSQCRSKSSSSVRSRSTPSRPARQATRTCWEARPPTSPSPRASSRHVRLVAVVGEDFPDGAPRLSGERAASILAGLERAKGKTFRWAGRYADDLRAPNLAGHAAQRLRRFPPKLPAAYRDADTLFLGNIHPALQLEVLEQVKNPQLVAWTR